MAEHMKKVLYTDIKFPPPHLVSPVIMSTGLMQDPSPRPQPVPLMQNRVGEKRLNH